MSKELEFNSIVNSIYQMESKSDILCVQKRISEYSEHYKDSAGTIDLTKHLKDRIDRTKIKRDE